MGVLWSEVKFITQFWLQTFLPQWKEINVHQEGRIIVFVTGLRLRCHKTTLQVVKKKASESWFATSVSAGLTNRSNLGCLKRLITKPNGFYVRLFGVTRVNLIKFICWVSSFFFKSLKVLGGGALEIIYSLFCSVIVGMWSVLPLQ